MKGRPPSRDKGFRDGFYFEVFNKGATTGIKIRKETREEMTKAAEDYRKDGKLVIELGEHRKGVWVDIAPAEEKKRGRKKAVPVVAIADDDDNEGSEDMLLEAMGEVDLDAEGPKKSKGKGEISLEEALVREKLQAIKTPGGVNAKLVPIKEKKLVPVGSKQAAKAVAKKSEPVAAKPAKQEKAKPAKAPAKKEAPKAKAKPVAKKATKKVAPKAKPVAKKAAPKAVAKKKPAKPVAKKKPVKPVAKKKKK